MKGGTKMNISIRNEDIKFKGLHWELASLIDSDIKSELDHLLDMYMHEIEVWVEEDDYEYSVTDTLISHLVYGVSDWLIVRYILLKAEDAWPDEQLDFIGHLSVDDALIFRSVITGERETTEDEFAMYDDYLMSVHDMYSYGSCEYSWMENINRYLNGSGDIGLEPALLLCMINILESEGWVLSWGEDMITKNTPYETVW